MAAISDFYTIVCVEVFDFDFLDYFSHPKIYVLLGTRINLLGI